MRPDAYSRFVISSRSTITLQPRPFIRSGTGWPSVLLDLHVNVVSIDTQADVFEVVVHPIRKNS
jgi:hypothetical protein